MGLVQGNKGGVNYDSNLDKVYKVAQRQGAKNLGSLDEFKARMQDEKGRRAVYDYLERKGVGNLGTFGEFSGRIYDSSLSGAQGIDLSQQPTPYADATAMHTPSADSDGRVRPMSVDDFVPANLRLAPSFATNKATDPQTGQVVRSARPTRERMPVLNDQGAPTPMLEDKEVYRDALTGKSYDPNNPEHAEAIVRGRQLASVDVKPAPITGFLPAMAQGFDNLWQGIKTFAGESANSMTGGSQKKHIEAIDIAREKLNELTRLRTKPNGEVYSWPRERAVELLLDWAKKESKTPEEIKKLEDNAFIETHQGMYVPNNEVAEEIRRDRAVKSLIDALERDGDRFIAGLNDTYQENKSWGDSLMDDAEKERAKHRETKGVSAFFGELVPSVAGTAVGLGVSALGAPSVGSAIAATSIGALTAGEVGSAMAEARKYGASNADIWASGLLSGAIEMGTEAIPFGRYFGRLGGKITGRVFQEGAERFVSEAGGKIANALSTPGSRIYKEMSNLVLRANKQLGGKLLNGKNLVDYMTDIAAEGSSEFFAEAFQTMAPMIYQHPEDYPELSEILGNGLHGALGGVVMGAGLGAVSKVGEHRHNKARRRAQGGVVVAELSPNGSHGDDIVEVVGKDPSSGKLIAIQDGERVEIDASEVRSLHGFTPEEFERGEVIALRERAFGSGYDMSESMDKHRATLELEIRDGELRKALGVDDSFDFDSFFGEDPLSVIKSMEGEWAQEQVDTAIDYVHAQAVYEGMIQRVRDDIDSQVSEAEAIIDSRIHQGTGNVRQATLKEGDKKVYLIDGDVALYEDGSGVHVAESDKFIVAVDEDGNKMTIAPQDILSVEAPLDAEAEKHAVRERIEQEVSQARAREIDVELSFAPGDSYTLVDEQGVQSIEQVLGVTEDGSILMQLADGRQQVRSRDEVQQMYERGLMADIIADEPQSAPADQSAEMEIPASDIAQTSDSRYQLDDTISLRMPDGSVSQARVVREEQDGSIGLELLDENGLPSGVVDMAREVLDRSIVEDTTGDNYSSSAYEKEDNETSVSARIPKNERGEPMYEAVDAQTAWDALVEQSSGDVELASEVARIMVEQKRAEVERISREPKGKEKPKGTPQEIMQELQERKAQIATAEAELAHWETIAVAHQSRIEASAQEEAVGDVTDMDALVVASEEVVNTEPTEEQKKAGNYRMGHLRIDGLDITIEQPRGSVRSGVDDDGNTWSTNMQHTYGYIRGTRGKDGDHIDLFLSDNLEGWNGDVYIVDQVDRHGSFDEHKVMYGFNSLEEAKSAYLSNYSDDWQGLGNITAVSRDEFKKWLKSSKRKIKPFSEYKRVVTGDVSIEAGSVEAGQEDVVGSNVDSDQGLSSSDFQPIGKGEFGNIYDQFRGNPQGAAAWLQDNQGGEAVGVFSHTELGDISLVWGDERGGLSHIIKRHIEEQNDFASVDDAVVAIDDVVTNGVFSRENADKVVIDYNGYRVVINKQTRGEDGSVISVGNWIVTAFDRSLNKKEKVSSGKTLTTPPSNPRADGVTLPSNDTSSSSESKGSKKEASAPTSSRTDVASTQGELLDDTATQQKSDASDATKVIETFENPSASSELGDANKLATESVLEALSDAGIEVVRATDAEVEAVLGARGSEMHMVWHGSPHAFDAFDHSYMGSGEGYQAYGWGTYVTEVEGIARSYADTLSGTSYKGGSWSNRSHREKFSQEEQEVVDDVLMALSKSNHGDISKALSDLKLAYTYRRNDILRRDNLSEGERQGRLDNLSRKSDILDTLDTGDFSVLKRNLYTVEIPDDTGRNYLRLDKRSPKTLIGKVLKYFSDNHPEFKVHIYGSRFYWERDGSTYNRGVEDGNQLYNTISNIFEYGDKDASLLLSAVGLKGITYPANHLNGGHSGGARNYVIFKEDDAKIVEHIQFMRTPQGVVYGWTEGGKIYLTEAGMQAETPIHEYTHIWANAMMHGNPEGWQSIKELLRDTPVWQEVISDPNYQHLSENEDAIASEVLSRVSGREGRRKMEDEAQRAIDEANGVFEKAKAISVLEKMRRALSKFWDWVGKSLFDIKHFDSVDSVADRVLYDLVNGTELGGGSQGGAEMRIEGEGYTEEIERIKSEAEASGTFMLAPNGKATNLSERQWLQVRTKAFKEWFGDWEKSARIEKLRTAEPVVLQGNEHEGKYELNGKSAQGYILSTLRGEYTNKDTGDVIRITRKGAEKVTRHDAESEVHLRSIASIPQMIENATFIEEVENDKSKNGFATYRYYVVGLRIDDVDYTAKLVVGVASNGDTYYDHALTEIEKGNLISAIDPIKRGFGTEEATLSEVKDKRLLSILQTDASKIVDENGEPMVVDEVFLKLSENPITRINKVISIARNLVNKAKALEKKYDITWGEDGSIEEMDWIYGNKELRDFYFKLVDYEEADKHYIKLIFDRLMEGEDPSKDIRVAFRYGEIPDEQRSFNYREQEFEQGVSVVGRVEDMNTSRHWLYDDLLGGESQYNVVVGLDTHYSGADGEMLLSPAFVVGKASTIGDIAKSATDNVGAFDGDNADIRFRHVWHGSGAEFDAFDHSYMGSGEGYQAYGWGAYVTEVEGIARSYADAYNDRENRPADDDFQTELIERLEQKLGLDTDPLSSPFELIWDGYGFLDFRIVEPKRETIERMLEYFRDHPGEFLSYEDADEINLDTLDEEAFDDLVRDLKESCLHIAKEIGLDMNQERTRRLYSVEIPDDTGDNYLYWDRVYDGDDLRSIADRIEQSMLSSEELFEEDYDYDDDSDDWEDVVSREIESWYSKELSGKDIQNNLAELFGQEGASEVLSRAGFVGVSYPAEHRTGGREDGARNYVIFKEDDAEINGLERFRRANGIYKPRMGNARVDAQEVADAVARVAEGLGERVRIVKDVREITHSDAGVQAKMRDSKGWYDRRTGEVVVVVPNHRSVKDAIATALHEIVGHKGLQELVGKDAFNAFLDGVYRDASEDIRRAIAERAMKQYRNNIRIATEEYIAELAERGFDDMPSRSLWSKIVDRVKAMLRSLGVNTGITENDMRYMLWRTYQLKSSQGGAFDRAEDIAGRMRMGVGDYAPRSRYEDLVNDRFNEELGRLTEENAQSSILYLGMPSATLLSAGVEPRRMKLYGNKVIKKMKKHGFALEELVNLPRAVANPIAVFNNLGRDGNRSILTELSTEQGNVLVTIDLGKGTTEVDFNIVSSVFGKADSKVVGWINKGYTTYVDKRKALDYLRIPAPIAGAQDNQGLLSATKIVEEFENPKLQASRDDSDIRYRSGNDNGGDDSDTAQKKYNHAVRRELNDEGKAKFSENKKHLLHEAYLDSMISVKELQDAIVEETGNELRDFEDAYTAQNQLSSRNKAEWEVYARDHYTPLTREVQALIRAGAIYDDIQRYMKAKHGLERNEYYARKAAEENGGSWDGRVTKDMAGLTALTGEEDINEMTLEAYRIVAEFEYKHNTSHLWDAVRSATRATLHKSFMSGMMSRKTYNDILGMYQYYVPLRGWSEERASDEYEYLTTGKRMISPILAKTKGRKSEADDVLATIGMMANSAIVSGNNNLMKQRLLNLAINNRTSLLTISKQWYVKDMVTGNFVESHPEIPHDATSEEVAQILAEHELRMQELAKEGNATQKRAGMADIGKRISAKERSEHCVKVIRGGEEYCLWVNGNPRAAQAINGLTNPEQIDFPGSSVAQDVKNFMSQVFTSKNPDFLISNLCRDLVWATTAVSIKEDKQYLKAYLGNIGGNVAKARLVSLLRKWNNGTLDLNNDTERLFDEFMRNGGETGFTNLMTLDQYKKDMERLVKEAQRGGKPLPARAWDGLWDGVEFMNRAAEDTSRFAVYMTSRQMGRSIDRSISDAKEITVNFNRKGSGDFGARLAGFAYIFFNASMQSLAGFGRLMRKHPWRTARSVATFLSSGMVVPMMNILLGSMLGDDDEYWDIPEYQRRNNICLYTPFGYIMIPLPHELRAFYGAGEAAFTAMMGKISVGDALLDAGKGLSGMLPLDFNGNGGDPFITLVPTIGQPIAQVLMNTDYFGSPIYKDTPYNELDPEWTKAYKGTNSLLVDASRGLSALTGGDDVERGWADGLFTNPAVVEHLIGGYTGGLGKTIGRVSKTIQMIWDDDMREVRNVPVLNRFFHMPSERTRDRVIKEAFYNSLDDAKEVEHKEQGYRRMLKNGVEAYADKYDRLLKSEEWKRYEIVYGYREAVGKMQKALKEASPKDAEELEKSIKSLMLEMRFELDRLETKESEERKAG